MASKSAIITVAALGTSPYAGILRVAVQTFDPKTGKLGADLVTRFKFDQVINRSNDGELVRWWTRESPDCNAIMADQGAALTLKAGYAQVLDFLRGHEVTAVWHDYRYDNINAFLEGIRQNVSDETLRYVLQSVRPLDYGSIFEFMGVKGEPAEVPSSRLQTHKWAARVLCDCMARYRDFAKNKPPVDSDEI